MKVSSFIRRTTLAVMLCGATFLSVVQADHHEAQAQKDVVDTAAGPDKRARRSLRHKDGHSIGAVLVVAREGVEGGVTFVFRSPGQEVVFAEVLQPGTGLVCDDRHLLHHTTALQGGPTWGDGETFLSWTSILGKRDTTVQTSSAGRSAKRARISKQLAVP